MRVKMDINKKIKTFNQERDWDQFHTPENISKSIAIEAGELLECFQWDNDFNQEKVIDELADILIYSYILAQKLEVNVEEIMHNKLEHNKQRYSVEKAKGNSKKYTEFSDGD